MYSMRTSSLLLLICLYEFTSFHPHLSFRRSRDDYLRKGILLVLGAYHRNSVYWPKSDCDPNVYKTLLKSLVRLELPVSNKADTRNLQSNTHYVYFGGLKVT